MPELRVFARTAADAAALALRYVDRGIYRFGGGADAGEPDPFDERGACDCSSFTAWSSGHARSQPTLGASFNTARIVRDIQGDRWLYDPVAPSAVRVGDLIVTSGAEDGQLYGHSGIIVAMTGAPTGPSWYRNITVVHCVASTSNQGGVRKTDGSPWRDRRVYFARPKFYRRAGVVVALGGLAAGFALVAWLKS